MKTNVNIEGKLVTIELTKDQLKHINSQLNDQISIEDLKDYKTACKVLSIKPENCPSYETQLKTIIRAANYISNGNIDWIPDSEKTSQSKWLPYFERNSSGWLLVGLLDCLWSTYCPVGYYFKNKSVGETIVKNNMPLYISWLNS